MLYDQGIQEEVSALPNSKSIGWLRVDAKPIKSALSTWVSKWSLKFTQYLLDRVTNKVAELLHFMNSAQVSEALFPPHCVRTSTRVHLHSAHSTALA